MSKPAKVKKIKVCQFCGSTEGVAKVIDPYVQELEGREVKIKACPKCIQDRVDDI